MRFQFHRGHRLRLTLAVAVFAAACHPLRGCIEARFDLPDDNRLPAWFELPSGMNRTDVAVRMDYWVGPTQRSATMSLRRASGGGLDSVVATMRGSEPLHVPPLAPGEATGIPATRSSRHVESQRSLSIDAPSRCSTSATTQPFDGHWVSSDQPA